MPATYESLQPYRDLLNRALEQSSLRIRLESRAKLVALRHRLYLTRKMDRDQSRSVYPPADERYGWSPYDVLTFTAEVRDTEEGKEFWLILTTSPTKIPGVQEVT